MHGECEFCGEDRSKKEKKYSRTRVASAQRKSCLGIYNHRMKTGNENVDIYTPGYAPRDAALFTETIHDGVEPQAARRAALAFRCVELMSKAENV